MIKQILLVGAGGAVGSIMRFLTSEVTTRYCSLTFPLATFIINILGCLGIGLLVNLIPSGNNLRFLLIIGFCGGFTTFSTFARETFDLIELNQMPLAFVYTMSSCILGVCAVWLGMYITK
ncbi:MULTISPECIES: fluoride efflux transporter CrcB [unclassified Dysgonomonas]|uniref:fluoride efflux transporter CrcB n=1 Tax=unclassified Dysgonomonas TaxID=2630389 RepID=UPI0013EBAD1A|nr:MULTISPECIES: fluoride efflux transporter CrcB [unclassified Dysgonomonas]